jgi:transcriptional regulator with XRE-family HTH domain
VAKKSVFLIQIGDRIRKERIKAGISQSQLAFEIKTSIRQIQRIESGDVNTGILSLHKIAEALEIDVKKLIP